MEKATLYFFMLLSWTLLSLTKPGLKALDFGVLFFSAAAMKAVWGLASFSFAPGVLKVLRSPVPPTIEWFKSLPFPTDQLLWAVYVLVLEQPGFRPKIYIGSGTDSKQGVARRMTSYERRSRTGNWESNVSQAIQDAMDAGFEITHYGLLIWIPLPPPAFQQALRGLFLDLEAVCTYYFWAMRSKTRTYGMPTIIKLWPAESFTYDSLCGHFSINEGFSYDPALTNFTPEEINEMAEARKKAKNRMYIANKGEGVHAARSKATREKALDAQLYSCDKCVLTFPNDAKLKAHLNSTAHKNKVAGIGRQTRGRGGGQRAIQSGKFRCETCNHNAPSQKRLDIHFGSKFHAKKLRVLAGKAKLELES